MQSVSKKTWLTPLILIVVIVLLHLFSFQPGWVENIYSAKIYPLVSCLLRILTRWVPFSFGDLLYSFLIAWAIFAIVRFFKRKPSWSKFLYAIRNLLVKCLWLYIIFLIAWGFNYYRYGIGYQMNLVPERYSTGDLKEVTAKIREKLNENRKIMDSLHIGYAGDAATLQQAVQLYDTAKSTYPFLAYRFPDVKKMMYGAIGNYSGFLGYYNPFTGEAQVNTRVPPFIIPFTACHEIGHQLGYASESEASFAGFLVVRSGHSPVFKYSAYFDLFSYANGELFFRDSTAARQNMQLLDTLVKKDLAAYRHYLHSYNNPVEILFSNIYGNYLKAHNQPLGIESYDEVVAWIVAYYKKYGYI